MIFQDRKNLIGKSSPWGAIQYHKRIAQGIDTVTTPSHGGIRLDNARQATLLKRFPSFATFAGGSWYEEDQDVAVVFLTFPECFDSATVRGAVRQITSMNKRDRESWLQVSAWLFGDSPEAAAIRKTADEFNQDHINHWEVGSLGSAPQGSPEHSWWVSFRRIGDRAKRTEIINDYPTKRFYTDAEIAQVLS